MTFYLRDSDNNTVVDLEVWVKTEDNGSSYVDISSLVDIKNYSKLLMAKYRDTMFDSSHRAFEPEQMAIEFNNMQELRGWLWESYAPLNGGNRAEIYAYVIEELKIIFIDMAKKYNLNFVID